MHFTIFTKYRIYTFLLKKYIEYILINIIKITRGLELAIRLFNLYLESSLSLNLIF